MILRRDPDTYALLGPLAVIGRAPGVELVLSSVRASGRHAEVRFRGGVWEIRDLGSTNGTFRNGRAVAAVTPEALRVGDHLTFGDATESWEVVYAGVPGPCLFDARTGARIDLEDADHVRFDAESRRWVGEDGAPLADGDRVDSWALHLPPMVAVATTRRDPVLLRDCTVVFRIEPDSDRVGVLIEGPSFHLEVEARAWGPVLLTLARARTGSDEGWLTLDRLTRRTGLERKVLDVYLARARGALRDGGVLDAARLVEARPGARRLGLEPTRVRYEPLP